MALKTVDIGPDHTLSLEDIFFVAHNPNVRVRISRIARAKIKKSRGVVDAMLRDNKIVYGITTGFGSFKDKRISSKDVQELQKNLIRSHAAGVGPLLSREQVRASLLVRLNSLAMGFSGVRQELLDLVCSLLNRDIIPVTPSQGSVGASGDLAPLSHMGLVLMGEGKVFYKGEIVPTKKAFAKEKLKSITFEAKEGLAFNNGTSVMAGCAALSLYRGLMLNELVDLSCAMTLEAIQGTSDAFDNAIHKLRPHPGQIWSAENIRRFIKGSRLVDSLPNRIQDSYSIRCSPQVHGAVRDALRYVRETVEREVNSVTDNPLIFSNPRRALSGGNFHGEPLAIAMDTFGIAIAELASIAERRVAKLVDPATSQGLPAFLIADKKGGLHSGFMIVQYTAAALVSENKVLAHPASVDSIPTSANQEDHVSMGSIAVQKAGRIIENAEKVISIEFLSATQALDFRTPSRLGAKTKKAYTLIRKNITPVVADRIMATDIECLHSLLPRLASIIVP